VTRQSPSDAALLHLRWVIGLTRLGLFAESFTRAFWPVWTIAFVVLAALMVGLQDHLPLEMIWICGFLAAAGMLVFLVRGARQLVLPSRDMAIARLDATLPGRPIAALRDAPAVGKDDAASQALWMAHQKRMAARTKGAKAVQPDLRISRLDPFGLRYTAILLLMMAFVGGSFSNLSSVRELGPGGGAAVASGPTWEGWIEPPRYTG